MGKKTRKNKNGGKTATLKCGSKKNTNGDVEPDVPFPATATASVGCKVDRPIIEPGRTAVVHGLVNRSDLNGQEVTVKELLRSGRVAVEIIHLQGSQLESKEVVAIRPENLEVRWSNINDTSTDTSGNNGMLDWGIEESECPICMDTMMNPAKNSSYMECCGGAICKNCFVKTQFTRQRDSCPLCRADTSDTSAAASVRKVRDRANRGDANAMYNLGAYYDGGMGVPRDQALARVWYKKAAEKGETRAAHNLACSCRDGEGGPVDKALAANYFRMAAENGHVQATTCLGIALMRGDGVERDMVEAKKWLRKGANAGDELAMQQLQIIGMMSGMGNMSFSSTEGA
eukprot:CAMPEP_0172553636 /NCGR_PEP_ID=MMETSP1067-20121228/51321_1 /TAXON_ID=265564 ORGANISM="Thalassiosira punctigera, Strain Tpunct2005C2" /NCGR_SAMPLE_ID=MMETSP1067 /ASSEMBLY_ACC=CAM_ASM_000444 /LENGTH=343 /DNA_ID=CAMNT_0013341851 /DNA_START=23 /DNA_END=1051 /DNA_ORIENTATION=+